MHQEIKHRSLSSMMYKMRQFQSNNVLTLLLLLCLVLAVPPPCCSFSNTFPALPRAARSRTIITRCALVSVSDSSHESNNDDDNDNAIDDAINGRSHGSASAMTMGRREALLMTGGASMGAFLPTFMFPNDDDKLILKSWEASAADSIDNNDPLESNVLLTNANNDIDIDNPSPNALLKSGISIPLISYSFYKTPFEQSPRALALALRAGIRHFDMASDYGITDSTNTNNSTIETIAPLFRRYFKKGKVDWYDYANNETQEVLQSLDNAHQSSDKVYKSMEYNATMQASKKRRKLIKPPQLRRCSIFLTYKLSNDEQSTNATSIRQIIHALLAKLDTPYLDLVSLHSPLTDSSRRLATYQALLQLQEEGLIKAVGVCNYGLCHLREIESRNLPLPSVNQLELSPFNTHADIVKYCQERDVLVGCAPFSRLSSVDGPVEQWEALGRLTLAKNKENKNSMGVGGGGRVVTKAQVLVRWALQKGFGCAPRSGTKSKLEVRR